MKDNKKKILLIIFTILVFVLVSLILSNKDMQNDTFYTIKVGEAIEKYGVDMKDHFSFIPDLKYTYPHWLYDLSIFKIYKHFGFNGLFASNIVLTFILCFTMFITSYKMSKNYGISFITTLFASAFLNPFVTVRAQLVSYILLLLILYFIEKLRNNGSYKNIIIIGILSIFLANIHAALYPLVFVLFLPFIVSDYLYKYIKPEKSSILEIDKPKNTKLLLITILICVVCGFLSLTGSSYTYIFNIMMGNSTSVIVEHAPASMLNNPFIFMYMGIIMLILLTKKFKISLSDLFMICGLILLSLMSLRSFALFIILSIYSFVRICITLEKNYLKHIDLSKIFTSTKTMIVVAILLSITCIFTFGYELKEEYVNSKDYPVDMVKYIKENIDYKNMRVYNEYNAGSYLMLNDIKVFIDSRSDLYMKEFNKDCHIFDDYKDMPYNYKYVLDKYDFTHILISNRDKLNVILEYLPNYKIIKQDDNFVLYEKTK